MVPLAAGWRRPEWNQIAQELSVEVSGPEAPPAGALLGYCATDTSCAGYVIKPLTNSPFKRNRAACGYFVPSSYRVARMAVCDGGAARGNGGAGKAKRGVARVKGRAKRPPPRLFIDGYNLALDQGTGVATLCPQPLLRLGAARLRGRRALWHPADPGPRSPDPRDRLFRRAGGRTQAMGGSPAPRQSLGHRPLWRKGDAGADHREGHRHDLPGLVAAFRRDLERAAPLSAGPGLFPRFPRPLAGPGGQAPRPDALDLPGAGPHAPGAEHLHPARPGAAPPALHDPRPQAALLPDGPGHREAFRPTSSPCPRIRAGTSSTCSACRRSG